MEYDPDRDKWVEKRPKPKVHWLAMEPKVQPVFEEPNESNEDMNDLSDLIIPPVGLNSNNNDHDNDLINNDQQIITQEEEWSDNEETTYDTSFEKQEDDEENLLTELKIDETPIVVSPNKPEANKEEKKPLSPLPLPLVASPTPEQIQKSDEIKKASEEIQKRSLFLRTSLLKKLQALSKTWCTQKSAKYFIIAVLVFMVLSVAVIVGAVVGTRDFTIKHNVTLNATTLASTTVQTTSTTTILTTTIQPCYVGCYADYQIWNWITDIGPKFYSSASNTIDMCIASCLADNYAYAGLQVGVKCFCGNSYGGIGLASESTECVGGCKCDTPCAGNASQICGGTLANSVYIVSSPCKF